MRSLPEPPTMCCCLQGEAKHTEELLAERRKMDEERAKMEEEKARIEAEKARIEAELQAELQAAREAHKKQMSEVGVGGEGRGGGRGVGGRCKCLGSMVCGGVRYGVWIMGRGEASDVLMDEGEGGGILGF